MKKANKILVMFMVTVLFACSILSAIAFAEVVTSETETAESAASETAPATTSSQSTERKEITAHGEYDGTLSGGGSFSWLEDKGIIFYDGNIVYGIIPVGDELEYVRFSEDGKSYDWEVLLSDSGETLRTYADYLYGIFTLRTNYLNDIFAPEGGYEDVEPNSIIEYVVDSSEIQEGERVLIDTRINNGLTEKGREFYWYEDQKIIFYNGKIVYGLLPDNGQLKLVRFAADGSFAWEHNMSDPLEMQDVADDILEVFHDKIEQYNSEFLE